MGVLLLAIVTFIVLSKKLVLPLLLPLLESCKIPLLLPPLLLPLTLPPLLPQQQLLLLPHLCYLGLMPLGHLVTVSVDQLLQLLFLLGLKTLILLLVVLINGLVKLLPLTQLLLMLNSCPLIKKVQSLLLYLLQSELDPYSVPLLLFHSLSLPLSSIDRYDIHDLFNIYKKLI